MNHQNDSTYFQRIARSENKRGEKHYLAKLTEENVRMMRSTYKQKKHSLDFLATMYAFRFKCSYTTIRNAITGKTWSHVEC